MIEEGTYQARSSVRGQLGKTPNGARFIGLLFEVRKGPYLGERVKWQGWVNSEENAKRTIASLRSAGWKGVRFGDWSGLGSVDCSIVVAHDEADDGKRYPRVAFVNKLATRAVRDEDELGTVETAEVNAAFSHLLFDQESGELVS